jgi:hypothetical protein
VVIEKSLLGVRILQTYRDVLAKLGQPKLVIRFGELIEMVSSLDANGNDTGGVSDITYEGGGGSSGGGPGGGGPPGMRGGGSGGGNLKSAPPPPGVGGSGGGGMGGPGTKGPGGGGGGGGSDADTTFGEAGGYIWAYEVPAKKTCYIFVFNLEGRVLAIIERGLNGGMPTQRGLKLGDNVKKLYDIYGWPDTIQDTEPGFTLDYGSKYHAKFAVMKDKIVGIGVVLEENERIPFFPINSSGGGGGGGGMKGGGGMGRPNMKGM